MGIIEVIAQAGQKINIVVRDQEFNVGRKKRSRDFISRCCSRAMRRRKGCLRQEN